MPSPKPERFAAYKTALQAISKRTGTPLPSLVLSFGILHEITAIAPIIGGFYMCRALGVGERAVNAVTESQSTSWMHDRMRSWMEEGQMRAERVGRRYGILGFDKGSKPEPSQPRLDIAGDIANAVVAYAAVKMLLPVRIGLSLYLSPAFSRRFVEPMRRLVARPFQK